jgi:uncharacterized membrane protein
MGSMQTRGSPAPFVVRIVWCCVLLLVAIGLIASIGRGFFLGDLAARAEQHRLALLTSLGISDPHAAQRPAEIAQMDGRFGEHPLATMLHIVSGGLFLLLAPFQFSARVRSRHLRFHRWSGRFLLAMAAVAAATGLYFGVLMPFGGSGEAILIVLVAALFLVSLTKAVIAIRQRDVARHRQWMIRAFGAAIAISMVRLVAAVVDLTLTPRGLALPAAFVASLWIGWGLSVGAAELWIRLYDIKYS